MRPSSALPFAIVAVLVPLACGCGQDVPVRLDSNKVAPSDSAKGCGELIGTRVVNVAPCKPP